MNDKPDLSAVQEDFLARRWESAESGCLRVLEQAPTYPPALELLAKIQTARGDFARAIETTEQAIGLSPNAADLYRQCGDLYFKTRDLKKAIQNYRKADSLLPNDHHIKNNLAVAVRDSGSVEEAIRMFESIICENPDQALPLRNLGDTLRMRGDYSLAIDKYNQAARLDPKDATTQNSLGITSSMLGKLEEAISYFQRAVEINPSFPEAENNLANALSSARRYTEAIKHVGKAIRLRPDFANAHLTLGNIYKLQGKNDQAISEYRLAAKSDPKSAIVQQGLGSALTDAGHFSEAVTHLENALKLNPSLFVIYQNLMALAVQDKYKFSDQQLEQIRRLISDDRLRATDAARLHFAMGSLLDKQTDYEGAMRHFQQANDVQKQLLVSSENQFCSRNHAFHVDEIIQTFDTAFMSNAASSGFESERPVFVIGMPRSGTTLVEQIIASHPEARGMGERADIAQLSESLACSTGLPYPACVRKAHQKQLFTLATRYEQGVSELATGASRIVDKMPDNFLYLGLIAMLFPGAHIIHCSRNPLDVCLSCYRSDFGSVTWAWTLEDIGHYFAEYHRLMTHWREVLPLTIHDVTYEELVGQHRSEMENLIAACGLPWNDVCLEFYKGNRTVQTLSRVQVRQPIYGSSIGRWRHYEGFLEPLKAMLQNKSGIDLP